MSNIQEDTVLKIKQLIENANKVLFVGIGEVNMTDDGFGPYIASYFTIRKKSNENVLFINGRTLPEERQDDIIDFSPDLMFIIDTCDSKDEPGTFIVAEENSMLNYLPISSHTLPIALFIRIIKEKIPELKTYLLGLNPFSLAGTEERNFYKPEEYNLDDYDNDPDLPFYEINLSPKALIIADELIEVLKKILSL